MTEQFDIWSGEFGKAYTDRNGHTVEELDALHQSDFGLARTELNSEFVGSMDKALRVLEVRTNVGTQLKGLEAMGFTRLYGIEAQAYALHQAKGFTRGMRFVQADAVRLPWRDRSFDLVFTSGVLIHISPDDIGRALDEIYRCANCYIWGWEYYAEEYTPVPYRGRNGLLWKANFARLYLDRFPDLRLLKEKRVPYLINSDANTMFLLEKPTS